MIRRPTVALHAVGIVLRSIGATTSLFF